MSSRGWTWVGSKKSVSTGEVSVLAAVEVLLASSAFWFVAVYLDSYTHIIAGIFLAPLSLLRSDESIRSVHGYYSRAEKRAHRFQLYGILTFLWLVYINPPTWIWIAVFVNGVAIGHLYNAWYVQFMHSLIYLRKGLANLPDNFYRSMFMVDVFVEPEMFPNSEQFIAVPHWKYSLFQRFPRNPLYILAGLNATTALVFICIMRLFIKSTIWFYLPILYIFGHSQRLAKSEELRIWLKSQTAKIHEWARFLFAVVTLLIAFIAAAEVDAFNDLLSASRVGETPVSVFSLIFVLDFHSLYPWQYLTLPSACLTVILFIWQDSLRREALAGREDFGWQPPFLVRTIRVRDLLVIGWLVIAFIYALDFWHENCKVAGWIDLILSIPFGKSNCK
jgi:hypothetical protein